jgi:superfamily II DNA or RNA helicase
MNKTREVVANEALEAILPFQRSGIGVSMGVGKTLIGLRHMNHDLKNEDMFLVVGPKNQIYNTWKEEAEKHGFQHLINHFEFSTYLSLTKIDLDKYKVIYLDECHSLKYSHESWLDQFKGKIVGLTGTPPKFERSEKGKMVAKFCPIVYKYITDSAVEDGILNDYEIIVHKISLSTIKNIQISKNGKTWFTSELDSYNFWCNKIDDAPTAKMLQIARIMRMRALMDFKSKETYTKSLMSKISSKLLVFANTHDQADRICIHSFHSKNPKSDQNLIDFKEGKISKLSCVHQLSEGVNIPNLKEEIIMHAYSNERKSSQRIGRGLRLDPGDKAIIHILCYKDTIDEVWVTNALSGFDKSKIIWK